MAVLSLLVVLVAQLVGGALASFTAARKQVDADTQARLIFDRMAADFANMLQRSDLDFSSFKQPGNLQSGPANDQLAFYARGIGYFSSASTPPPSSQRATQALVAYYMDTDPFFYGGKKPVLQRIGKGLGWEPDSQGAFYNLAYLPVTIAGATNAQWPYLLNTSAAGNKDPDWKTVGDQVFRFEYNYLLKPNYTGTAAYAARLSNTPYWDASTNKMMPVNPHTAINGFQDVAAIVVAIGVLDSASSLIVTNNNGLTQILPDAAEGSDIQAAWQTIVRSPTFAKSAGIPQKAASSIRTYERYFYLSPH